jgi:hypothetical protein
MYIEEETRLTRHLRALFVDPDFYSCGQGTYWETPRDRKRGRKHGGSVEGTLDCLTVSVRIDTLYLNDSH